MYAAFGTAAVHFLSLPGLFYLGGGVIIGLLFGTIPGLGGATAIALLIPLTYGMSPNDAMMLFGGIMGAVMFGGSISAILLNTPGVAPNAATCLDGYPLAQQGKAGMAIGAAATASSLGGIFGVVILIVTLPLARAIVLLFGPPEFFMLAMLGLSAIAVSTGGHVVRGLISAGLGLVCAFVGFDNVSGVVRFTGGIDFLWDGFNIVPVLIGLFAIAEMLKLSIVGGTVAAVDSRLPITGVTDGIKAALRHYPTVLRGGAIGTFIGAVPGVGGTVAAFLSYSVESNIAKGEPFGTGNIRGVIAPEAAANAKDGGSLIPTLAFGIPGSAEMAVFLGVLILHGLTPGPMLLVEHADTIFMLILALLVSCIVASLVGIACARWLTWITTINVGLLVPVVVSISFLGAYAINKELGDVFVAAGFGALGYLMMKFDYPRVTLVIAFVLGGLAERTFHQSLIMARGDWTIFFTRSVSLILFCLIVFAFLVPVFARLLKRRRKASHA